MSPVEKASAGDRAANLRSAPPALAGVSVTLHRLTVAMLVGAGQRVGAHGFREFDVVTDQQPDAQPVQRSHGEPGLARLEIFFLEVAEQVGLTAIGELLTVAVDH